MREPDLLSQNEPDPRAARSLLPGDDGTSNPDRSRDPKFRRENATTSALMDQLNEAWRQMRLLGRAVTDRDRIIDQLHQSIHEREATISALHKRLRLSNRARPFIYAAAGGACAKIAEIAVSHFSR